MRSLAIIGAQWGDEGKGKITDLLSEKSDVVARFQGGGNAGHTIVADGKKIILHLIPSGILHQHCLCIIGHGVAFDPRAFKEELLQLKAAGVEVSPDRLKISRNCPVTTSYAKLLDCERESKSALTIGTTSKGIGPTYEDKISRRAIKLSDLLDKKRLLEKLKANLEEKAVLFEHLYGIEYPSVEEEASQLGELGELLAPFLDDTFALLDESKNKKQKIIYEGAQGVLLDIDYGSYPFVTSSNTSVGGIYTGLGVIDHGIDEVLGVVKAYITRVGEGPFPTELEGAMGDSLQQKGGEFGATTGRLRRCGWIDLPMIKYAIKVSNITSLALTKVDVLSGLEQLKVCSKYKCQGEVVDCAYPGIDFTQVEPIFEEMTPFTDQFVGKEFSPELENYISVIEKAVSCKVGVVAYGPEREQVVFRKKYF